MATITNKGAIMKKWGLGLALSITIIALFVFCKGAITQESGHGPQLTIYNQNFAVVKEIRELALKSGESQFRASDITAFLDPTSVILRDLKNPESLKVLEQNYEANPLSQGLLLQKFEGKDITLEVYDPDTKQITLKKAKIIRS